MSILNIFNLLCFISDSIAVLELGKFKLAMTSLML